MPKPIINKNQTHIEPLSELSISKRQVTDGKTEQMDKLKIDRLLRKPRSKEYMDAIRKLDAGGHAHNHNQLEEIIDTIKGEFSELEIVGVMIGIVSTCYLGHPYEVHTLDITGKIIKHYEIGVSLPHGLEKARSLAIRGGYEFIEVYSDCCRCVDSMGNVSVVHM